MTKQRRPKRSSRPRHLRVVASRQQLSSSESESEINTSTKRFEPTQLGTRGSVWEVEKEAIVAERNESYKEPHFTDQPYSLSEGERVPLRSDGRAFEVPADSEGTSTSITDSDGRGYIELSNPAWEACVANKKVHYTISRTDDWLGTAVSVGNDEAAAPAEDYDSDGGENLLLPGSPIDPERCAPQ